VFERCCLRRLVVADGMRLRWTVQASTSTKEEIYLSLDGSATVYREQFTDGAQRAARARRSILTPAATGRFAQKSGRVLCVTGDARRGRRRRTSRRRGPGGSCMCGSTWLMSEKLGTGRAILVVDLRVHPRRRGCISFARESGRARQECRRADRRRYRLDRPKKLVAIPATLAERDRLPQRGPGESESGATS